MSWTKPPCAGRSGPGWRGKRIARTGSQTGPRQRRSMGLMSAPAPTLEDAIQAALATVDDPEIRRPITDLGMVKGFTVTDRKITVELLLTVSGCPLRDKLDNDITAALTKIPGIEQVQ